MFCVKCGGLLMPDRSKGGLVCASCGHAEKKTSAGIKISEKGKKEREIEVIEKAEVDLLPKMRIACNKCQNQEAYYWHVQTRAADEPETRFNRCTKCAHTWRSYG